MSNGSRPTSHRPLSQTRRTFLQFDALEIREVLSADIRAIEGTNNNLAHPEWGTAETAFLRIANTSYTDGLSTPNTSGPSARAVSNALADQGSADVISDRGLAAMIYAWGQFLDHDLDLSGTASPKQSLNIAVPTGDAYFDPNATGTQVIPLSRSDYDPASGVTGPRQQLNHITSWIDGSMVYGSTADTANKLRTMSGGKLKAGDDNLLPYNNAANFPEGTVPMGNAGPTPADQLFAAGDVRANENLELTAIQTLFMREHNRLADQIAKDHPDFTDEQIYQQARALVIGEIQAITYREWLPTLLGPAGLKKYMGYDPKVNPGIANEFATAGFRFGHSLLGDDIRFLDDNGNPVADDITLAEGFFNPGVIGETGIDPLLKYLASDPASEVDTKVVGSVRNFLFGPPGAGGLDLASLNIQRGRDHGLADYNTTRKAYGLPKVTSFAQITKNVDMQKALKETYGSVDKIDLWVGALAEGHLAGSSVGPLTQRILADQFQRLRDGDRFWYQRQFTGETLKFLDSTTLADVIKRNTTLTNLQGNVFVFKVGISGQVFDDRNGNGRQEKGELGVAGRTIQLIEADTGEVIATTQTDKQGKYKFDTLSGLELGSFQVREVLPAGSVQTTKDPATVTIKQGDTFVNGVDFGVRKAVTPTPPQPPKPPLPTPKKTELAAADIVFAQMNQSPSVVTTLQDTPTKTPIATPPKDAPPPPKAGTTATTTTTTPTTPSQPLGTPLPLPLPAPLGAGGLRKGK